MNNLNNRDIHARIDFLLEILDAPEEESISLYEANENPYDVVTREEVVAWCATDTEPLIDVQSGKLIEVREDGGAVLAPAIVSVGLILAAVAMVAWATWHLYLLGAALGLALWLMSNTV